MDILIKKNKNKLVTSENINFTELVKNSNTTLSLNLQSKMIDKLNKTFDEKEQHWYVANLYMYMNYHPTNDFPINLEHVFKMIGFANKGNAMKTIKSNFVEDEDYKVALFHTEKRKNEGGFNKETVMLNVDTFKNLCMIAKTDKGKEIRKYYVKLETIYNEIIKEELEEQKLILQNKDNELQDKDKELERTKKQLESKTKLKVKRWFDSDPGDTIYLVENYNSIKIGKTKNIKTRETAYVNDVFYIKKCYNCDLTEKVIHHMLDKYRIEHDKEYFDISKELAIYTIDIVCDFLDKFINYSEELQKSQLKEHLSDSLEIVKNLSKETKPLVNNECNQHVSISSKIEIPEINNCTDFDKFINDYCELDDDYYTTKYDLIGAFRLWCKSEINREKQKLLIEYLNQKFKYKDKFIADYGSRFCVYLGIRPKKLQFNIENENNPTKFEEFITEKCHINYTFNIKYTDCINTYKQWLNIKYPNHLLNINEEIDIKAYLNKNFMFGKINVNGGKNGKGVVGMWGIQLKTMELPSFALQGRRKKTVYVIDCHDNSVLYTFESATITAEKMKIDARMLSDYIRFKRIIDLDNKKVIFSYVTLVTF